MSQENVELVMRLQPARDVDIARLFRDDAAFGALAGAMARLTHPDVEFVGVDGVRGERTGRGIDALREPWLEWMSPWDTYRVEIVEARDLGDRVLLLTRDFGRLKGSTHEVALTAASVWAVRDGKIVRAEFHSDRTTALESVGLAG
jgi:ketosteroid isomerase-like protein